MRIVLLLVVLVLSACGKDSPKQESFQTKCYAEPVYPGGPVYPYCQKVGQ